MWASDRGEPLAMIRLSVGNYNTEHRPRTGSDRVGQGGGLDGFYRGQTSTQAAAAQFNVKKH